MKLVGGLLRYVALRKSNIHGRAGARSRIQTAEFLGAPSTRHMTSFYSTAHSGLPAPTHFLKNLFAAFYPTGHVVMPSPDHFRKDLFAVFYPTGHVGMPNQARFSVGLLPCFIPRGM